MFGEYELAYYYGLSKNQMLKLLCVGYAASAFVWSFLGVLSDLVGHKKSCLAFYMLHLLVSVCKRVSVGWQAFAFHWPPRYFPSVSRHGKLGQKQDSLNDMFWLTTLFESASFIGSQMMANYLVDGDLNKNITSIWNGALVLAVVAIVFITRGRKYDTQIPSVKDYRVSFNRHVISDKSVLLLSWAQACTNFSISTFWILWAPTIVADRREVSLGLIYPCLLGAKMLGSTGFPWLIHRPLALRTEEYLVCALIIVGVALSIVAYDYQEIGVLVTLFCLFHACIGVVLPSLPRLRTMYVPNEVRGGMTSLSMTLASAALLFFLILRDYCSRYIGNSTIMAFAAVGLF